MGLIACPECRGQVSDRAAACPHCGYPLRPWRPFWGYEYKSARTVRGWPLLHVALGVDPETGRPRIARGVVALGNVAVGGLACGGIALGAVSFGGVSLGLVSLGGFAVGLLLAVGGFAAGTVAIGGAAVGYLAVGGGVLGVHALGGNRQDPALLDFLGRWLGPNS